jgi:hypothetical protein
MHYWDYMAQFSDTCADINNPLFTEKCGKLIIDNLGLDSLYIERCISDEIAKSKAFY